MTQTGSRHAAVYSIGLDVITDNLINIGQVMEPVAEPYKPAHRNLARRLPPAGFALSDAIVYNAEDLNFAPESSYLVFLPWEGRDHPGHYAGDLQLCGAEFSVR
jgi:hypothetical protein